MSQPQYQPLPCPVCGTHALVSHTKLFKRPQRWDQTEQIRWIQTGPSRSGSTVVFQLINLFDDGATVKTHALQQLDCPMLLDISGLICTIRHPYDMFASLLYMFKKKEPESLSLTEDADIMSKLDKEIKSLIGLIRYEKYMLPLYTSLGYDLCPIVFLKYEEMQEFPERRVSEIAKIMGVDLSEDDILKITNNHTVDKNLARIAAGEHRTEEIKGTIKTKHIYFEKNHISPGKGKSQGHRIPDDIKTLIYEKYSEIFEAFDYER